MKNYWIDSQRGIVIQIMIKKWEKNWYQDFELEKCWKLFLGNNSWPRLSELLKNWVVEVEYFANEKAMYSWMSKKAKYRLVPYRAMYYKELYNVKPLIFNMF